MKWLMLWLVRIYRYALSPFLGNNCRYYPSCSCYTEEAIEKYGAGRGLWMGLKRVARCHPWHPGGYDPVPELEQTPESKPKSDAPRS